MRLSTGIAFIAGTLVSAWLASIDRAHWYSRYGVELQVQHCTKSDRE